jgi:hypothetical protein
MKKLLLTTVAVLALTSAAAAREYPTAVCGQAVVTPYEYDSNPVVFTEVAYNPETHVWQILHHRQDGSIVSRAQQYAIVDSTQGSLAQWEGDLLRNPTLHMVGTMDHEGHYQERIWNKTLRRWVTQIDTDCRMQQAQVPPPVPQGTVLQGYPAAPPVQNYYQQGVPQAPAPVQVPYQQPAPAQAPAPGGQIIIIK